MNSEGGYVFFKESRTKEAILQLKGFHEAIISYCQDVFSIYPDIERMNAGIELYDALLGFFSSDARLYEQNLTSEYAANDRVSYANAANCVQGKVQFLKNLIICHGR